MLLAVIDLAEAGDLEANVIRYEPVLLDRYHQYFAAVRGDTDHPNSYFRALDRNLIAPGPDYKWHVSAVLDPRIGDYQPLHKLDGQQILFHGEERFRPAPEALEWRFEHLLQTE